MDDRQPTSAAGQVGQPAELTRREALIAGGSAALTGAVTWLVTSFVSRGDEADQTTVVTERTPAAGQASVAVADAAPPPTPPLSPASAAPLGLTVLQYEPQRIANLAELEIDRPKPFGFPTPAQSALLVRLGRRAAGGVGPKGDVVAFSDICTHMGCPLGGTYSAGHKVLGPCVCHFTTFDLRQRGVVVVGQATDDLPQVELRFDASTGDLFATGLMGLVYGHRSNLDALVAAGSGS